MPDGNSYQFDATKLNGVEASGYILRSEFDTLSGAVKGGIIFKGTEFAQITVGDKTYNVTKQAVQGDAYVVPTSNMVINGVTCDSGDMWICVSETGSVQPENPALFEQFNAENWVIVQGNVDVAAIQTEVLKHTHDLSGTTAGANDTVVINGSDFKFKGTTATHNHTFTLNAHNHTFSGSAATITADLSANEVEFTGSYTPEGSVTITPTGSVVVDNGGSEYTPSGTITGDGSHSHDVKFSLPVPSGLGIDKAGAHTHDVSAEGQYTPAGTVNGGTHSVDTSSTANVLSDVDLVGTYDAENHILTLSLTTSAESVLTDVTISDHTLSFGGTAATIRVSGTATTAGEHDHTGSVNTTDRQFTVASETATHTHGFAGATVTLGFSGGSVTGSLTGTAATIRVKGTPTGTVTFNYTPAGTVNDGGAVATTAVSDYTYTPAGAIQGTVTATTAGHTHAVGDLKLGNGNKQQG